MPVFPFQFPASDFIDSVLHDTNVVAEAVARLVQQYKKPKLQALVAALAAPFQDLEDVFNQIYVMRWLNTATGAQLDVLGKIVGQARGGFTDDAYRPLIQGKIAANRSSGGPEELYHILTLITPPGTTFAIRYFQPASFVLTVTGALYAALGNAASILIRQARAGGVGGQLVWSEFAPANTFTLDGSSSQALDNGHLAEVSL